MGLVHCGTGPFSFKNLNFMKNSKNTHFLLTFAIQYSIIEIQRSIILIRRVTNMATSIVQFRIDDDLKNQATELYDMVSTFRLQ